MTGLGRLVMIAAGWLPAMGISPALELLCHRMGIREAPTLQQEITPLTSPARNAVQKGQEGWIMGGFILHHHSGSRCQATG